MKKGAAVSLQLSLRTTGQATSSMADHRQHPRAARLALRTPPEQCNDPCMRAPIRRRVQVRLAAVRSIARIEAARSGSRTNVLAELLTTETDRTGHYR